MREALPVVALLALLLGGCAPRLSDDDRFAGMANRCLTGWRDLDPEWASDLGDHRHDHLLTDRSRDGLALRAAFWSCYRDSLARVDAARLSPGNRADRRILLDRLEASLWAHDELREQSWNPLLYNPGGALHNLLAHDHAPLAVRLRSLRGRLEALPDVLGAARANLERPPRVHTEMAIAQNQGLLELVREALPQYLDREPELRAELEPAIAAAAAAIAAHGRWLEEELLPRSDGDFRLGPEPFRRKLRYVLGADLPPAQILAEAEQDLAQTRRRLVEAARPLHARLLSSAASDGAAAAGAAAEDALVRAVLDKLAETRPDDQTLPTYAQMALAACRAFAQKHDLVTVPPQPIQITLMPSFRRGVVIASCDIGGPLENDRRASFSLSPPPADWSPARRDSFYREYNFYMLLNLTAHEAIPGHFLQQAHANRVEAPTLTRAILPSGTFVEGWATYAEELMVEHGFGGDEVRLQHLKMRLRLPLNAIIDHRLHAGDLTEGEAIDLLMRLGYQEEGEAVRKWRRACVSSGQLTTYFVGNREIRRIRDAWDAQRGGPASPAELKAFHDRLLSFGAPPTPLLRELMGL